MALRFCSRYFTLNSQSKAVFARTRKSNGRTSFASSALIDDKYKCHDWKSSCTSFHVPLLVPHRFISKWRRYPKYDPPVDWLPFTWKERPKFDIFENSGDRVKELKVDLSLPKPGFELSDELKTASDYVKRVFSLRTATKADIVEVANNELLKKVQRHPCDFDSLEVKIALQTIRVRKLFQHREHKPKHKVGKVILLEAINKRNKLLNQLYKLNVECFNWLIEVIEVDYEPPALGFTPEKYTKKNELRRLTKEYCEKMRQDKLNAFHEELKSQQEAFLREKEETLAWIAEEEKALGVDSSGDLKN